MEDNKITELFLERSEQAITELSSKYGKALAKISFNILGNAEDAEECVNEAYLAAWNTIPPQNPTSLFTYVCRLTRNVSLTKYSSNTAQKRNSAYDVALEELEQILPDSFSVEGELEAEETAKLLDSFLESLDRESRILFVRRYCYSDTIPELAKRFRTSEHNVSVRLFRLRQKLKKYLSKSGVQL